MKNYESPKYGGKTGQSKREKLGQAAGLHNAPFEAPQDFLRLDQARSHKISNLGISGSSARGPPTRGLRGQAQIIGSNIRESLMISIFVSSLYACRYEY